MNKQKTIHIYYHIDYDGLVSAFLTRRLLEKKGFKVEYGEALDYNEKTKEHWLEYPFKKPFVIVDFKYHPGVSGFVDHHENHRPEKNTDHLSLYKYDADAPSAAILVSQLAKEKKISLGNVSQLVKSATTVDTADFAGHGLTPEDIVMAKTDVAKIVRVLEKDHTVVPKILNDLQPHGFLETIQSEWFGRWLKRIVKKPYIKDQVAEIQKESFESIRKFLERSKSDGFLVKYDMTKIPFNRYLPAMAYPKSVLWFGMAYYEGKYAVKFNLNPWASASDKAKLKDVHLGKLAEKFGGGGHAAIGTVYVYSREEVQSLYNKIMPEIQKIVD